MEEIFPEIPQYCGSHLTGTLSLLTHVQGKQYPSKAAHKSRHSISALYTLIIMHKLLLRSTRELGSTVQRGVGDSEPPHDNPSHHHRSTVPGIEHYDITVERVPMYCTYQQQGRRNSLRALSSRNRIRHQRLPYRSIRISVSRLCKYWRLKVYYF